jgi:hypothetical protein
MKCKNCGEQVDKSQTFCPSCGEKQDNYTSPRPFETNSVDESQNPQIQKSTFKGKQTSVGTSGKIEFKKGGFFRKVFRLGVIAVVVIVALVLLFGGGPSVSNLTTASEIDVDTYEPITETSTFTTSIDEIFVTFDIDGYDVGTEVMGQWYYVTEDMMITDVSLVTQYENQYAYFSLTRPLAGWPLGEYRVDILINDDVVDSVDFVIE